MRILSCLLTLVFFSLPLDAQQPEEVAKTYAIQISAEDTAALEEALSEGSFRRWVIDRDPSFSLQIGPDAEGEFLLHAALGTVPQELRALLDGAPVRFEDGAVTLGDEIYRGSQYVLALRATRGMVEGETEKRPTVAIGWDIDRLARLIDRLLVVSARQNWWSDKLDRDYLVWEHAYSHRSGNWTVNDGKIGLDPNERNDFVDRAAIYDGLFETKGENMLLYAPVKDENLGEVLDGVAGVAAAKLGVSLRPRPEVVIENDYVVQGRHLGKIGPAVIAKVDDTERLHIVNHPDDLQLARHGMARLLLRRLEPAPSPLAFPVITDGAALWITQRWYGRTWRQWLPDLAQARVFPEAEEILAEDLGGSASDVLWAPIAAALIDRLPGKTLVEKLQSLERAKIGEVAQYLQAIEQEALASSPQPPVQKKARPLDGFLHGVSFAMANGLDIGYHAPGVDGQIERLQALGVDAVSVMPFAYQQYPDQPELSFLNHSPSSETDIGMMHVARRAHAKGVNVLWKPHIWVSHESWPGDIAMQSEEDWQSWWRHYRRFILHHAVLASASEVELFSVGIELGKTLAREEEWRDLIASVRRVYGGALTYSGNWWGDFEHVPFWDDLEFIGVDAYFPLASSADAEREELEKGAREAKRKIAAVAEKWERPVLLTEVGFSARVGAWVSPADEGGELSEEHQKLAYEVLLGELGRPPWLRGIFIWKAFSHEEAEDGGRPDFRFLGRPAEEVIRKYLIDPPSPQGD